MIVLTRRLIDAAATGGGAWKKAQLAVLGVAWPPRKGWKNGLIGKAVSEAIYDRFVALGGVKTLPQPKQIPHPPKQKTNAPFVGWVSDEKGEVWGEFCGGDTQAECLEALAGHYRKGQVRCFVTRGDNPAVVFDRVAGGKR